MVDKKKKMSMGSKITLGIIFLFFAYSAFSLFVPSGVTNGTVVNEEFTACLLNADATFYGTEWCSHCANQKQILGDAYTQHKSEFYVDCDAQPLACSDAGVRAYPTWEINGQNYEGVKTIEQLASLMGC